MSATLNAACAPESHRLSWEWTRSGSTGVLATTSALVLPPNTLDAGVSYVFTVTAAYPAGKPSPPLEGQLTIAVFRSTPIPALSPPSQSHPSANLPLDATSTVDPDYPGSPEKLWFIWECTGSISRACSDFMNAAGGVNGGSLVQYDLPIEADENIEIQFYACTLPAETQVCAPRIRRIYPIFHGPH